MVVGTTRVVSVPITSYGTTRLMVMRLGRVVGTKTKTESQSVMKKIQKRD
jgi:hypothetical protein